MVNRFSLGVIVLLIIGLWLLFAENKKADMSISNSEQTIKKLQTERDLAKGQLKMLKLEYVKLADQKKKDDSVFAHTEAEIRYIDRPVLKESPTKDEYIDFLETDNRALSELSKLQGKGIAQLQTSLKNRDAMIDNLEKANQNMQVQLDLADAQLAEKDKIIEAERAKGKKFKKQRNGAGIVAGVILVLVLL